MDFEPLGYGNRGFDRSEARRRRGLLIVTAFGVIEMLVIWSARHTQLALSELVRIAVGVGGMLVWHFCGINQLSLVGRASNSNGRFKYPIRKNRYHLIALTVAIAGGVVVAQPWPDSLFFARVTALGLAMLVDGFFIFKAIRSPERGNQ